MKLHKGKRKHEQSQPSRLIYYHIAYHRRHNRISRLCDGNVGRKMRWEVRSGPDTSTTASSEQAAGDDHQLEIRALIIKKSFIARFLLAR